ncbi:MAG: hypothetical protein HYY84_12160 [Deltaproteobacteria bacterium]|nr:hypothetical protein [Deltaproteobacteria bacterium]
MSWPLKAGFFAALGSIAGAAGCGTTDTLVPSTLSSLRVSGNRVLTEDGKAIRLRGVHFMDPFVLDVDDLNQDGIPDRHFDRIETDFMRVQALGANVVRVAFYLFDHLVSRDGPSRRLVRVNG